MIVAFVCTGNICRSPIAEAIATSLRLPDHQFVSAGTGAMPGLPATADAVLAAAEVGADLSGHRSRDISDLGLIEPDEILTMEPHHSRAVVAEFPAWAERVRLLDPAGEPIADPYRRSLAHYREARDRIVAALHVHESRWLG